VDRRGSDRWGRVQATSCRGRAWPAVRRSRRRHRRLRLARSRRHRDQARRRVV